MAEHFGADFSDFGTHFLDSMLDMQIEENAEPMVTIPGNYDDAFDSQDPLSFYPEVQLGEGDPLPMTPTPALPVLSGNKFLNPWSVTKQTEAVSVSPVKKYELNEESKKRMFLNKLYPTNIKEICMEKMEGNSNSNEISSEERDYYQKLFPDQNDLKSVKYCRIHCTMCNGHIGCSTYAGNIFKIHRILQVLVCDRCFNFYGDGKFPTDASDNSEIYCRWCGQGGQLICCSFCPKVFCKKCIKQNLGMSYQKKIEAADDWACFCCALKPIWPLRAICRALSAYWAKEREKNKKTMDLCTCCSNKTKPIVAKTTAIVTKPTATVTKTTPAKPTPAKTVAKKNDIIVIDDASPPRPKPTILGKLQKSSATITPKTNSIVIQPPRLTPKPPLLQRITPYRTSPPALVARPKPPPSTAKVPPMVSFRTQPVLVNTPKPENGPIKLSDVTTVKVPVNPHGLILRLKLPDMKVFLVKLDVDPSLASPVDTKPGFKMPEFKTNQKDEFFDTALKDTFKLEQMVFERLMILKQLYDTKTAINEKEIMKTVTKKTHFILAKAAELFTEIDEVLVREHEAWKVNRKKDRPVQIDVIDLSDEEDSNTFKTNDASALASIFLTKSKDPFKEIEDKNDSDRRDSVENKNNPKKNANNIIEINQKDLEEASTSSNYTPYCNESDTELSETSGEFRKRKHSLSSNPEKGLKKLKVEYQVKECSIDLSIKNEYNDDDDKEKSKDDDKEKSKNDDKEKSMDDDKEKSKNDDIMENLEKDDVEKPKENNETKRKLDKDNQEKSSQDTKEEQTKDDDSKETNGEKSTGQDVVKEDLYKNVRKRQCAFKSTGGRLNFP